MLYDSRHILGCLFIVICLDILYVVFKVQYVLSILKCTGLSVSVQSTNGDEEIRTLDPLLARQVLSQLSYIPNEIRLNPLERCQSWA